MSSPPQRTGCLVVGGGPAGMVLGLLLARAGVEVTVLEKHPDFLHDFRGDTVHPSTLTLVDELGLAEKFDKVPHRDLSILSFAIGGKVVQFADFSHIHWPHKVVRMVPQWDFLSLLADEAATEPKFQLLMETKVTELLRDGDRVTGVRYVSAAGQTGEIHAPLTVGCDGRHSLVRDLAGLPVHDIRVPVDSWWLTVPRGDDTDIEGGVGMFFPGRMFVLIDRGDSWQIAYLFPKGDNEKLRQRPIAALRQEIADLIPWLAGSVSALQSWDQVPFLDIKVNRLRRWHAPGVLCIGDAAHAMSPAGGPGVNLAVQDAVATARLLAPSLLRGEVTEKDLAKVRARRAYPTWVLQTLQGLLHRLVFEPVLAAKGELKVPLAARIIVRYPWLGRYPAHLIGVGPRPEHAPEFARRPARVS
ncbi:FAD-dependent oxidoreductase [Fodinicola acaciae]|uniref:FAD-dependent oxidoreductase n=1 Tax=Fodinicola acaciae TaxID=2681555 RepID=UPI002483548D|nr:FAD-dependent oxidoreductase [Fodinicola acaciae]